MSRGNQRQNIFRDDEAGRLRFVSTVGEACQKTGWHVHAYCLMRNHFHWVIETPSANLVAGMSQMEEMRRGGERRLITANTIMSIVRTLHLHGLDSGAVAAQQHKFNLRQIYTFDLYF